MALLRQMQPLVSIMALGIGLGLIGNSFGTIPTSGSALFGFAATILAGATMGLIGGGGSILTVPILVYLLEIPPVLATGYSLFVVGLSALVGSVNYFKLGLVNLKAGTIFAVPAFVGVFLARKFLVPALPVEIFNLGNLVVGRDLIVMGVFATVMILASVSMIRGGSESEQEGELQFNYPLIALEGLIVGAVTGFVGAGGGFLIIPALVVLAKLPMKQAVGTSLMIIAVKSLFGFLGDLGNQSIDWGFLALFCLLSIIGIYLGTYLSRFVSSAKLKPGFGWFVLIMGLFILAKETIL
ncbi:MAG: sulfite exporter TauE/SafE family protein [SAR324 cluster bacterium]|nr:sulfite exporter TauE/SafE family protein [SAR324 cluster bacterium]